MKLSGTNSVNCLFLEEEKNILEMFYTAENFFFDNKHSFKPIQKKFRPSTNSLTNFNTALLFQLKSFTVISRKTFCFTGSPVDIFRHNLFWFSLDINKTFARNTTLTDKE